ncbi:MerR family transcriptional regulator [Brevundimonas diminuta]|uniref:MerR family transcriptional regulator n=1 Tax=Brevundimonas diminuta TaxID=293 RepID=UPI003D9A9E8E
MRVQAPFESTKTLERTDGRDSERAGGPTTPCWQTTLPGADRHIERPSRRPSYTISEIAQRVGTTVRALRYYEDCGLLHPGRTKGNARRYSEDCLETARLVRHLRSAGIGVADILAALNGAPRFPSERLVALVSRRLDAINAEQRLLRAILSASPTVGTIDATTSPQ